MTGPDAWFAAAGAAAWGTCAYEDVRPHMDAPALARAEALCPAPAGIYVAAFPYFPGEAPGNLSLYARGEDYHAAVARRLDRVCAALRPSHPGRCFAPLVDNSPLPEQLCAALAGLGLRGRNTLTILPPWGTWLFFGRHPHRSASGECSRSRSGVHGLRQMHCGLSRRRIGPQRPGP